MALTHTGRSGHAQPLGKHRIGTCNSARALRRHAAQVQEDIDSMLPALVSRAESRGWDDAQVVAGDLIIKQLEQQRDTLLAEAKKREMAA